MTDCISMEIDQQAPRLGFVDVSQQEVLAAYLMETAVRGEQPGVTPRLSRTHNCMLEQLALTILFRILKSLAPARRIASFDQGIYYRDKSLSGRRSELRTLSLSQRLAHPV
jgi:hypothetical protein